MISAAGILRDVEPGSPVWQVVTALDSWGFTVAGTRISVWTVLLAMAIVIGGILLARLAIRWACWLLARVTRLDSAQTSLAQKLITIAIWAATFMIAIDVLGIDLTALAVFSGAFGLAVGFGLQKTFGNLIAGIILLMDRSIKPGDVISVNDGVSNTFGQVKRIGIRAVSVTTRDKKEYLIPNENLMTNQVENWSYSSREVRVRIPVTVASTADLDVAEKLMLQAAQEAPRVLDSPQPRVWLIEFANTGFAFEIRVWINDPEEGLASVKSEVLKRLWQLFQENGIELGNALQRDVWLRGTPALRELTAALRDGEPSPDRSS
jgi:small-conductance mechanosensitive channel